MFYLLLSTLLTPMALNKSRQLLGQDQLNSLPTIRAQQFSDRLKDLLLLLKKSNNEVKNIFLHDTEIILKIFQLTQEIYLILQL